MLRLTPLFTLVALPIVLCQLRAFHHRLRPPRGLLACNLEDVVIAAFPIAWFFGFLYYTDIPSLVSVLATIVAAAQQKHWLAGLLGLVSAVFRQTNIIWTLYAFAISQLTTLRFQNRSKEQKIYDPSALEANPSDLIKVILTFPRAIPSLIQPSIPYIICCLVFGSFVVWNGGIVLGDKSNHIPVIHIPQIYYFIASATFFAWPVLISCEGGPIALAKDVYQRMVGSPRRIAVTILVLVAMLFTIHMFTIHHPFLLSDNRHYTFYIWRRIYRRHPMIPYLLAPVYLTCAWAWFLRIGKDQTLLQTLALPLATLPALLPTPLLEPRYFLIPYILLRVQVLDVPTWAVILEALWYTVINSATMFVFLYAERPGVGRFMW